MSRAPSRRQFPQQASQRSAVLAAATSLGGVHPLADEKPAHVRLGIVGCGSIMTLHVKGLVDRRETVSISWLCDVAPAQIPRMDTFVTRDFQAARRKRTARYEEVIEDKDVDAVIIATPHHWHAPMALRAMAAGEDCSIEKPISHVFNEGPLIIAAAKKYRRVVQQGSQMRSSPVTAKAEKLWPAWLRQWQRLLRDRGLHDFLALRRVQRFSRSEGNSRPTEGKELSGQRGYAEHMAEFLNGVRRRTPTKASADVAHRSCALVHLGEIAYRPRGRLDFDVHTERFIDCDEANALLGTKYREPHGLPGHGA